jgi:hypothetical protein
VPQIKIVAGFVSDVPRTAVGRFTFRIGAEATSVSMTVLPVPPFASNEYVALAVTPGFLPGSSCVALAYRNVGQRAPAHPASRVTASVGILLALMGIINLVFLSGGAPLIVLSLSCVGAGLVGFIRIRSIAKARRLLAEWKPLDP